MIFPSVAELLGLVGRLPAVEQTLEGLRRTASEARLAALTDPAKALVVAHVAAELRRPLVLLVESNQRAERMAEPLRFFYRALASKPATGVGLLPALDVLPWQHLSPHSEILETRAATLWRFSTGQAQVVIAPVASALLRLRAPGFYRSLARTLARDEEADFEELVSHLASVGYERQEMVEMPGQYAVRGGIIDVFSPEAARPVRLELLGDTVESIREFDPATQRSVGPLERVTLPPLTEFPRSAQGVDPSDQNRYPETVPGWEFEAARLRPAEGSVLELSDHPIIVLDEPDALEAAADAFQKRAVEFHEGAAEVAEARPAAYYIAPAEWDAVLGRHQKLAAASLSKRSQVPGSATT